MSNNNDAARNPEPVVVVYNGQPKREIPRNVTHLIVASSVTEIPRRTFRQLSALVNVEIQEGLQVIRGGAFWNCGKLSKLSNFPSTL